MSNHEIDWERLDRYVTRQGTAAELEALAAWVDSDPELRAIAAAMRTAGRGPGSTDMDPAWDARSAWQRLRRRMHRAPLRVLATADRPRAAVVPRWLMGLAAAAAIVLVIFASDALRHSARTGVLRDVATRRGQTASLYLPDGSRVTLGPESRLRMRADAARDVALEGEAYFEVKHDSTRPFRVHTATGTVQDVGTAFVVTAYPETRGMRVVVASGSVALYHASRADRPLLTLTQGDLAQVASAGTTSLRHAVDVAPFLGWTEGDLAFDGIRLRDAVPQLERWYDVEIALADSAIGERRLTATFRHEPLSQVLPLVALSLDLDVQRQGTGTSVLLVPTHGRRRAP